MWYCWMEWWWNGYWKLLQLQVGGLSQCLFNFEEKSFLADRLQLVSQECDSYLYIGWWTRLVSVGVVQTLLSLLDIVFIMISPPSPIYTIQYTVYTDKNIINTLHLHTHNLLIMSSYIFFWLVFRFEVLVIFHFIGTIP